MKNLFSILVFVIALLSINSSFGCTCDTSSFCGSISDSTSVLQVVVIEKYDATPGDPSGTYADVKIIGTLQNEIIEDTITIAGVLQGSCDEPLPAMEVGDTLLINFPELVLSYFDAKHPAFQLYSCQVYILRLSEGVVTGNIQPDLSSMSYDDFVASLGDCNDFVNSTEDLNDLKNEITISPNPFSENITIDFGNLATYKISLEIFSAQGQRITSENNLSQSNYQFSTSTLSTGIYFVKIIFRDDFIMKKIVKL